MTIELNEKEYRALLDIAHMADVIVAGVHQEADARVVQHRDLIQKLFNYAEKTRAGAVAAAAGRRNSSLLDFEKSTVAHALIDEFGTRLFWNELINKLTERDAARIAGGIEHLNAMDEGDRETVEGPIRKHYLDEFTQYGLENILLIKGFVAAGRRDKKTSD